MACKYPTWTASYLASENVDVPIARAAPLSIFPNESIKIKLAIRTSIMRIKIARGENVVWTGAAQSHFKS